MPSSRRTLLVLLSLAALVMLGVDVGAVAVHHPKHTNAASSISPTTEPATSTSAAPATSTAPTSAAPTTAAAGSPTTAVSHAPTTAPAATGLTSKGSGRVAGAQPEAAPTGGPDLLGAGLMLIVVAGLVRGLARRIAPTR